MNPVEQFTVGTANVSIYQDEDPSNPRKEFDHAGKMVCWHRRYDLGDKHDFADNKAFMEWWKDNGDCGILMPLYLYDHSGITISTAAFSCPWDSGQVGWIYLTRATILKEWGKGNRISPKARKQAEACLKSEVNEYDQYLTGDVYGYVVECDGKEESCWGYYGMEYCEQEARSMAQHLSDKHALTERETAMAECCP